MRRLAGAALFAWLLAVSCASLLDIGSIVAVEHVRQRGFTDCAIAALAMASRNTYETVDKARVKLGLEIEGGIASAEIIRIGDAVGVHLTRIEPDAFNFVTGEGIVVVQLVSQPKPALAHAMYVAQGDVYDPLKWAPMAWVMIQSEWSRIHFVLTRTHA